MLTGQLQEVRGPPLSASGMRGEIQRAHFLVAHVRHIGALAVARATSGRQIGCNTKTRRGNFIKCRVGHWWRIRLQRDLSRLKDGAMLRPSNCDPVNDRHAAFRPRSNFQAFKISSILKFSSSEIAIRLFEISKHRIAVIFNAR